MLKLVELSWKRIRSAKLNHQSVLIGQNAFIMPEVEGFTFVSSSTGLLRVASAMGTVNQINNGQKIEGSDSIVSG